MTNLSRAKLAAAALSVSLIACILVFAPSPTSIAFAELVPEPTPTPEAAFDQEAAIAKIRESIKGRENEPAGKVFKNVENLSEMPAGRLLAVMQFGYSRSLGVDCTHCHSAENFASEAKPQKQIARDMHVMMGKITGEMLGKMESLGGRQAIVNCTTCHRGQIKPATNLQPN
ncbi:MAG: photosynthetic reaction center cytochrome c subunit [Acidobacteria bacterium]|nr:MAG: photosynthetic reaction center cytochrome c subunit [Acidobacteriota bacterium]REJ98942.1 MAG: photosynthetic reaction center cytochrome c subunit [Acidobacteriota bacterium]REK16338.1 MAG: photosynthetic reaction center cytochrome c subunit [Acidobacteriota bacterium]REK44019.1 MAG: photosynthetic reaction center cytochrome c subunit [Acidobacteriota bacterium]